MLDTNLPRKKIFMRLPTADLEHVPAPILPPGYRFATYGRGRCADWAKVETRVGEFSSTEAAVEYFRLVFLAHPDLARKHVQFVFNPAGVAVATASAWFGYSSDGTRADRTGSPSTRLSRGAASASGVRSSAAVRAGRGPGCVAHDANLEPRRGRAHHSLGFRLSTEEAIRYDAVDNGRLVVRESPNEYAEAMAVLEQVMAPELLEEMRVAPCEYGQRPQWLGANITTSARYIITLGSPSARGGTNVPAVKQAWENGVMRNLLGDRSDFPPPESDAAARALAAGKLR